MEEIQVTQAWVEAVTPKLGYEQLVALRLLRDEPDQEGSALCARADCSWEELFRLAEIGAVHPGNGRLTKFASHPVITGVGKRLIQEAERIMGRKL